MELGVFRLGHSSGGLVFSSMIQFVTMTDNAANVAMAT
jgi:hypothetical protein